MCAVALDSRIRFSTVQPSTLRHRQVEDDQIGRQLDRLFRPARPSDAVNTFQPFERR